MIDQVVKFVLNASDSELAFIEQAILFRNVRNNKSVLDELKAIESFPTGTSWTVEQNKELWRLVKEDQKTADIARKLGRTSSRVAAQISKLRKFVDKNK